jgi:hypothetical protein
VELRYQRSSGGEKSHKYWTGIKIIIGSRGICGFFSGTLNGVVRLRIGRMTQQIQNPKDIKHNEFGLESPVSVYEQ